MTRSLTLPLALGSVLLLLACDAQVDATYAGEAWVQIRGTAVGFEEGDAAGSAAVLWNRNDGPDIPSGPLSNEPLHARFPSGISIDVLGKPPQEAFFRFPDDDAAIAEGYLFLVRDGFSGALSEDDFVGAAVDTVLVYVEGEVRPDSLAAKYLGGVRTPGYHLLGWVATADLSDAQRALASLCADTLVAAGSMTRDQAANDCGSSRRYQLTDTASDLASVVRFYRHRGGP